MKLGLSPTEGEENKVLRKISEPKTEEEIKLHKEEI
jgi:hypothetical protein